MRRILVVLALGSVLPGVTGPARAALIEGFESGNLSAYTYVGTTNAVVDPAYAHDGNYGLGIEGDGWIYRDDAGSHVQQGDKISYWVEFSNLVDGRAYFGFGATAAGTLSLVLAPNTGEFKFQENPGYDFNQLDAVPQSYLADHWYRAEVDWGIGGTLTGKLFDSDGTTLLNTVTSFSNLFTEGGIAFRGFSGVKAFDTVTVGAVPEPSSLAIVVVAGLAALGVGRLRRRVA